ncbi:MAG: ABC-type multidrug transport system fused ATPase/permease subunit [Sulfurimonas sp.]|jgi:ABC-type multidrug transport system fused ATPase/permease subunit
MLICAMIKFILVFLFINVFLLADGYPPDFSAPEKPNQDCCIKSKCSDYEIKLINYQNQIIELYKIVSNVDTDNTLINYKIVEIEKYYNKILENQSKEFDVKMVIVQKHYERKIDDLFHIFYIIMTITTFLIISITYLLNFFGRKKIIQFVRKQITKNLTNDLISEQVKGFEKNTEFNKLVKGIIDDVKTTENDIVSDPL